MYYLCNRQVCARMFLFATMHKLTQQRVLLVFMDWN